MMLREHKDQFSAFKQNAENVKRQTELSLQQMREQYEEKEQELLYQVQIL